MTDDETFVSARHAAVVFVERQIAFHQGLRILGLHWTSEGLRCHTHQTLPSALRPAADAMYAPSVAAYKALRGFGVSEESCHDLSRVAAYYAIAIERRYSPSAWQTGYYENERSVARRNAQAAARDRDIVAAQAEMQAKLDEVAPAEPDPEDQGVAA